MKKTHRRPFWLIVRYRSSGTEVLRNTLASGEEALPVFSFEDEARMFLELGTSGRWQVREMAAAELTSVLVSSCAGVGRVVLDPLPGPFGETVMDLASVGRQAFMESYLRNGGTSPFLTGPGRRRGGMGARRATFEKG